MSHLEVVIDLDILGTQAIVRISDILIIHSCEVVLVEGELGMEVSLGVEQILLGLADKVIESPHFLQD